MSRSASVSPHSTAGRDRGVAAWSLAGGQAHDRAAHAVLDLTAPASGLVTPAGDQLLGFDVGEGGAADRCLGARRRHLRHLGAGG